MPKVFFGIIYLIVALIVFHTTVRCMKRKEDMAGVTAQVCFFGALSVFAISAALFSNEYMIMSLAYSVQGACMDFLLISLLDCTYRMADFGKINKWIKRGLLAFAVTDAALILSNPWTNFVLTFQQEIAENGDLYLYYSGRPWDMLHLGFCYTLLLICYIVLIVKCVKMPVIYAGRYIMEIVMLTTIAGINLLFIVSSVKMDYSCLFFGLAAIYMYHIVFDYRPTIARAYVRGMVIDKMHEPLVLFDIKEHLVDYNQEAADKFGLKKEDLCYMTREYFETNILLLSYEKEITQFSKEVVVTQDYEDLTYKMNIQMLKSKRGRNLGELCMFHDITKQKTMYKALEKMSLYDSLTGFYTNRAFEQQMKELDEAKENYIVAICNISGMKLLNSIYERKIGDKIIMVMAEELRSVLPEDTVIAYMEDNYTVMVARGITEDQMNLYLATAARRVNQLALPKVPIYLNYGVACRENTAVSIQEYIRYAEMDLMLKKGQNGMEQRRQMSRALCEEYFECEYESKAHVERIKVIARKMADKLGLPEKEKEKLDLLCYFHDIGRVKTREEVWSHDKIISRDELDVIKLHPITGFQIASELELGHDISNLILYHHENYNGSGYPYGLSGDAIPLLSKILAIVDSYDIMVNDQLYKGAITQESALEELHKYSGTQFDPELVKLFKECLKERSVN